MLLTQPMHGEGNASVPDASSLILRLFGRFEAYARKTPLPIIHSRHEHLLLALLALEKGQPMERSIAATRLWPPDEHSSFRAESNLRRTLYNLRKALGDEAFRLPDPRRMSRTLSLDISGADIDVVTFDNLIARRQPEALEQAVALYRGPLLMGYTEAQITESHPGWLWILDERRKRQQAFRKAVTELSVHAQVLGDQTSAIDYLQRAVEADVHWQPGYRLLMEALAKAGKRQEALAVYKRLCRLLRREERDEPEPGIIALYERLKRPPRPTPPPPRAPRSDLEKTKGNLPVAATRFIERESDVVQVVSYLQSQRLVTLTGAGGVGKTRLSLRVAEEIKESFEDGAWFVDLSTLTAAADTRRVTEAIANALRARTIVRETDPVKSLVDFCADKALLLVLDNCEHVVEATVPIVTQILESCPGVRILATSRQILGLPGEIRWYVPSLPTPDPAHLPPGSNRWVDYVRSFPAVALFVERGAAARPGFQVTEENAQIVADICHRLDGIPLALELAAARVQATSITELSRSLDDLFVPDPVGYRVPKERHRTLRFLIDWSYDLLQEPERKVLRRLSVFRGGFTPEAAAVVCADSVLTARQIRPLLAHLVEKSLLVYEEQNTAARYRLLQTIRHYSLEKLMESGECAEQKSRHRQYYTELAEKADPELRGEEQMVWLRLLEADQDNLRAALEYAFDTPDREDDRDPNAVNMGLRLAGSLWHFWEMRGTHAEGYKWLRTALEKSTDRELAYARALIAVAVVADDFCEGEQVIPLVEQGVDLARQIGNRWWTGFGLLSLGWVYRPVDRTKTSACMEEAVHLAREEGDPWLTAFICSAMGYHELDTKNFPNARARFQEALVNVRRARDMWLLDEIVYHLGLVACCERAYDEALHHFGECLTFQQKLGTQTRSALVRYYKANVHFRKGDAETARTLLHESLLRARDFRTPRTLTAALRTLASLEMAGGHPERAAVLFGAVSGLRETIDTSLLSLWDADFEEYERQSRTALGDEIYAVLSSRGQMMPMEQAVAFALN